MHETHRPTLPQSSPKPILGAYELCWYCDIAYREIRLEIVARLQGRSEIYEITRILNHHPHIEDWESARDYYEEDGLREMRRGLADIYQAPVSLELVPTGRLYGHRMA